MSRVSTPGQDKTYEATADLSASQFCFVKGAAGPAGGVNARVALCGANERMVAVLQNKPSAAGIGAVCRLSGTSKVKVDGSGTAIAANDPLKADASGRGVKATVDKDKVGAIAMEASSAANDVIETVIRMYDLAV